MEEDVADCTPRGIPANPLRMAEERDKINTSQASPLGKLLNDMTNEDTYEGRVRLAYEIAKIFPAELADILCLDQPVQNDDGERRKALKDIEDSPGAGFFDDTATRPNLQRAGLLHHSIGEPDPVEASSSYTHERQLMHKDLRDLEVRDLAFKALLSVPAAEAARLVSTQPPRDLRDHAQESEAQTSTQSSGELSRSTRPRTAESTNPTTVTATDTASQLSNSAKEPGERVQSDPRVEKRTRKRLQKQKKVKIAPCPEPVCNPPYKKVGHLLNHIEKDHPDLKLPSYCKEHDIPFDIYSHCLNHWVYHDSSKEKLIRLRGRSKWLIGPDDKKINRRDYDLGRSTTPNNPTISSGP